MTDILEDMAESVEANAANFLGLMKTMGDAWPTMQVHIDPDMMWWFTGIPFPLFNGVGGARFTKKVADRRIKEVIEIGRAHRVPLMWQLDSTNKPDDLDQRLEAHGFGHRDEVPGMAVLLADLKEEGLYPEGVTIEPVRDVETLKVYARILCDVFQFSDSVRDAFVEGLNAIGLTASQPVLHYLARLEGEPVGISTLYAGQGVAGIYNVAVLPEIRGRGVGGAITLAPLLDARATGYRIGILQASDMGYPIYKRLGYQENCKIVRYFWMPGEEDEAG